jgi:drug/metabolite transporter (DMT)-like permease
MEDQAVIQPPKAGPAAGQKPRKGWFFNPYTQILASILLSTAAQVLLKKAADQSIPAIWLGIEGLRSGWEWLGICALIASLFSWLYGLRFVPLNIAFNLAGLVMALVPLAAWLLLGEKIGPTRWCGIALVCAGVYVIARPLMHAEEKL